MFPAPRQTRLDRTTLSSATTRAQRALHSMRAQFGQNRMDVDLAAGVAPDSNPFLRERARYLVSRGSRMKMVAGLDLALNQGRRPALHIAPLPVDAQEVRAAAPSLTMLVRRLRDSRPIDPQGAAMTNILLTDRSGPLYNPDSPSDLETAARRALAALDADGGGRQKAESSLTVSPGRNRVARRSVTVDRRPERIK